MPRDLPGTGSKTRRLGRFRHIECTGFTGGMPPAAGSRRNCRSALALGRTRTIWRVAAAKSDDPVKPDTPHAQVLLPVPGSSRASSLLRLRQNQKQSCKLLLLLLLLLIFIPRKSRHHKTRLGCRLNAGGALWVERHGCRESAARTWISFSAGAVEKCQPPHKSHTGTLLFSTRSKSWTGFCNTCITTPLASKV